MKRTALVWMLMISLCFMLPSVAMAQKKPMTVKIGAGQAVVGYLEGTAQALRKGTSDWRSLKLNSALSGGDEVSVGKKARLELTLPDRSTLRFADGTRFKIVQAFDKTSDVKVHVTVGRAWANVSKAIGIKRKFEVSCDNAVAGVRGTIYRMNVNDDKSALVRVYDGEVAVAGATKPMDVGEQVFGKKPTKISGPTPIAGPTKIKMEEWVVLLRSMMQVSIGSNGKADKPREFTEGEDRDEWVDWNKKRDAEINL
ncbi:MAG: FecR family protein [Syntrophales bacterium]|nr:FecR family protein [Syntrophales bacterium]